MSSLKRKRDNENEPELPREPSSQQPEEFAALHNFVTKFSQQAQEIQNLKTENAKLKSSNDILEDQTRSQDERMSTYAKDIMARNSIIAQLIDFVLRHGSLAGMQSVYLLPYLILLLIFQIRASRKGAKEGQRAQRSCKNILPTSVPTDGRVR